MRRLARARVHRRDCAATGGDTLPRLGPLSETAVSFENEHSQSFDALVLATGCPPGIAFLPAADAPGSLGPGRERIGGHDGQQVLLTAIGF